MKDFELVRKTVNGKTVWTFKFHDEKGMIHTKTCRKCTSKKEALAFMESFQKNNPDKLLIKNIASDMFLNESEHLQRLKMFGKTLCQKTIEQKRFIIELIISEFGSRRLDELTIAEIETRLIKDTKHSGSWKNFYLETFGNIYDESIWKCNKAINKPKFQRFARNSRKADIFTSEELSKFFDQKIWESKAEWLLFALTAACGLRLGEAMAIQVRQLNLYEGILVVDGFMRRNGRTNFNKKGSNENRKIRCLPLPDNLIMELAAHISVNNLEMDDYLFTDLNCRTFSKYHLERTFKKVLNKTSINYMNRKLVPHSFRYTYVTRLRTVVPVEDVQKMVGHTSPEMTEYYTRPLLEDLCSSAKAKKAVVNRLFDSSVI